MAKKPLNDKNKKKPKKPKSAAEEKQNFKKELEARIASYQEVTETDGFLQRRNVRTALGIGNLKKWAKEFEDGYARTVSTPPKKPVNVNKPYSNPPEEKPLIQKVNKEQPRKRKPPDKRKGDKK